MATKKIVIGKEEGAGEVVDRILSEPNTTLVLVIPKGSTLGKSPRNFHIIKRDAADAGKEISIESVDENILAFAKNAGMDIYHPLLKERSATGVSGISDIVPIARDRELHEENEEEGVSEEASEPVRGKKRAAPPRKLSVEIVEKGEDEEEALEYEKNITDGGVEQEEQSFFKEEDRFFKKRQIPVADETEEEEEETSHHHVMTGKRIAWTVAVLVVIVAALYGITTVFGSAKINITFKKTPWASQKNFIAEESVSKIDATNNIIPAQAFSVNKNITQLFPASGQANVSQKAQGTLTIYNAYSSSPQSLVATTRFVTPDGKIFRLVSSVIVPGAAITNGKIVPSSIKVTVVADQPGPNYNVSSTPKLTIPGFEGSPKYDAFYGSIASSTSGGFIGEKAIPTASDVTAAKQKVTDILTSDLQESLVGSYTSNFKILPGATNIQITKLAINTSTDANGNFSVFGEGMLSAIGFDESSSPTTSLKYFLLSLAQPIEANSMFSDLTLNYTSVTPDFTNGKLSFSLSAQGSLQPVFSVDGFQNGIAGKKIADAKNAIAALPELQEGTISVWPSWLWQIPASTKKIQVTVN